ncbi:MAG: FHA domain-containing protein [Pseudonocardiaceae bacterium]
MTTCPAGHDSATTDYCDTCGTPLTGTNPAVTPAQQCAQCGATRDGRFCEVCGHDATRPVDPLSAIALPGPGEWAVAVPAVAVAGPGEWSALVQADRSWFEEVRRRGGPDVATLEFPRYCPQRRFTLSGTQLAIGRRSQSRGVEPDIDLSGPPLDPGVSALHALLVARPDGGWGLVDLDSTNGTTLGDATDPVAPNTAVALAHGDRIKLGAWTTITVTFAVSPGSGPGPAAGPGGDR